MEQPASPLIDRLAFVDDQLDDLDEEAGMQAAYEFKNKCSIINVQDMEDVLKKNGTRHKYSIFS